MILYGIKYAIIHLANQNGSVHCTVIRIGGYSKLKIKSETFKSPTIFTFIESAFRKFDTWLLMLAIIKNVYKRFQFFQQTMDQQFHA